MQRSRPWCRFCAGRRLYNKFLGPREDGARALEQWTVHVLVSFSSKVENLQILFIFEETLAVNIKLIYLR